MPTLNINVSQETLDKIRSLERKGITKKLIVDVAIKIVNIDIITDSIKAEEPKREDNGKWIIQE